MPKPNAAKLRITLLDLEPAPWREVEVRQSTTLKALHDTIQAAFCWHDCHLWAFDVAGTHYGPGADMDGDDHQNPLARNMRLDKLIEKGVTRFDYTYDFGDDWRHGVEILDIFSVEDDERLPRFVVGEHRAPPEDIGGPPGYEYLLEIAGNPDHPDREDYAHILEDPLGGPFDPNDIQLETIKGLMSRVARRKATKPKA